MSDIQPLHRFLRTEFDAEAQSGFARLRRVPDTRVRHFLDYYTSLNSSDQDALADAATLWATLRLTPQVELQYRETLGGHPAWNLWRKEAVTGRRRDPHDYLSVPSLRTCVAQAKIDRARTGVSTVSKELEDYAASVRGVKAPELRKHVRAVLSSLLGARPSKIGGGDWDYAGSLDGTQLVVGIDYGGSHAQLRYSIDVISTERPLRLKRAGFEVALGAGVGDWNFITEQNLGDSMLLLSDCVRYVSDLAHRLPQGLFG